MKSSASCNLLCSDRDGYADKSEMKTEPPFAKIQHVRKLGKIKFDTYLSEVLKRNGNKLVGAMHFSLLPPLSFFLFSIHPAKLQNSKGCAYDLSGLEQYDTELSSQAPTEAFENQASEDRPDGPCCHVRMHINSPLQIEYCLDGYPSPTCTNTPMHPPNDV